MNNNKENMKPHEIFRKIENDYWYSEYTEDCMFLDDTEAMTQHIEDAVLDHDLDLEETILRHELQLSYAKAHTLSHYFKLKYGHGMFNITPTKKKILLDRSLIVKKLFDFMTNVVPAGTFVEHGITDKVIKLLAVYHKWHFKEHLKFKLSIGNTCRRNLKLHPDDKENEDFWMRFATEYNKEHLTLYYNKVYVEFKTASDIITDKQLNEVMAAYNKP